MKKLSKEQFLNLLSNFGVYRRGNYNVPEWVLSDCFDEFAENGSINPLLCYERVLFAKWAINESHTSFGHNILSEDDIQFLESYLSGNEYYIPTEDDLMLKPYIKYSKNFWENQSSYKNRRKIASRNTSKKEVRNAVFSRNEYKCVSCKSTRNLTVDHIIPISKGGEDCLNNYQTLCRSCNSRKGSK